ALAVGLLRHHPDGRDRLRRPVVRPRRPVRGVQRRRIAVLAVPSQPEQRPHRDRQPFDHLPSLPIRPGTVTMLAVLLGSTAFDSCSASTDWRNFVDHFAQSSAAQSAMRTAGLLVFIAVVVTTFSLAARATGGVDRETKRKLPGLIAHSLIPIVIGYMFAHYL